MTLHLQIHAIGTKLPSWAEQGVQNYAKRFNPPYPLTLKTFPMSRSPKAPSELIKEKEGALLLKSLTDKDIVVALDEKGKLWDTPMLSDKLALWESTTQHVIFLIGGPDGLSAACKKRAQETWSLSPLTLPHAIARILVVEQLYRVVTIRQNHPYHRV